MKNSEFKLNRRAHFERSCVAAKQAGLTLLEVLISLTIIASATIGLNAIADRFSDDTKNTVTASQVRTFGEAAKAYIKNNYSAVLGVASPTMPAMIDVPTLIASGNLTAGFLATNAFGQSICALALEPTANNLQVMVIAEGGTVIDDLSLGNIASVIGGSGGGVYTSNAGVIRGAIGGWSIPTATFNNLVNNVNRRCDGTAGNVQFTGGHPAMALWFENGDTSSAYLARDAVPGRPELNAMNTPLVMNSVQPSGGACSTVGAIARDGDGGVLSCKSGSWQAPTGSDGSKCVDTTSDLNNLQTDGRCYNGSSLPNSPAGAEWVFVEVFRHTNPANYYVAQRVIGMTSAAAGKVWMRNQQSDTQAGGWSAWIQQADPGVSASNSTLFAGRGQFSRDGNGPCCGDIGTISLSENTQTTGKTASISLHNGGVNEGNIELANGGGVTRIRLLNNQGQGMGLEASGTITAPRVTANGTGLLGGAWQPGYDIGAGRIAAGDSVYAYNKICAGNSSGDCTGSGGAILYANGDIKANGQISVGANNRILGNGSQWAYGATTIAGDKNGWTGLEYRDAAGNYQINQMTNRAQMGYYDATSGRWLNYTDTSGNQTFDQTGDYSSGRLNPGWAVETWGCSTGQIAKAAYTVADGWAWNGKTLSCVSGIWKAPGALAQTQLYVCPQYCLRWGAAPFLSTQNWCNNNYDSGWQACTAIGKSMQ